MNSPANQDPFFTRLIVAVLDKATAKQDVTMLVARHLVTLGGGLLAGHGIETGDTKQIIFGVGFALIIAVWSWFVRVLHLDEQVVELGRSELVRSALAALASQAVTAISAALAVDANNPSLLVAALINLGLSKLDVHQRLASLGTAKTLIVAGSLLSMVSCTALQKAEAVAYGERVAIAAGEVAVEVASLRVEELRAEFEMLRVQAVPWREVVAKKLALAAAQETLKAARRALSQERARLDKQPHTVVSEH